VPDPESTDDLYALDPEQFTAARNQLAKRIRGDGDRERAAAVAKLRRPPATAWVLNRVARSSSKLIDDLLTAGERLQSAMNDALAGDRSGVRDAEAAERDARAAVVDAASVELEESGRPANDANRQRMIGTLRAAVVDDAVADLLRRGVLDADQEAPGFGFGSLSVPAAPARPPRPKPRQEEDKAEQERQRRARARHAELVAEAKVLSQRAERLAGEADDAERRATDARAAADAAAVDAADARRQADESKTDVDAS
jgi:hypothetical protein